ncbi:uncharacterized protein LOC143147818 [Ptiloglossa arizonensis]|uniref:uncharacterized protein LOC143147818 n=1 Tax=Ptiloglossa arizonensis TaxID=3350558 RepID=UPI003FA1228F
MCASNSPCRPQPHSPTESPTNHVRFQQQQQQPPLPPLHPHPYAYYPSPLPPYTPYNPYGPYAAHSPNAYYSSPYCNNVAQEPKGSSSWISIILLVLVILCAVSIVFYRSLSRDTRRRINARLPIITQTLQVCSGCCVILVYYLTR